MKHHSRKPDFATGSGGRSQPSVDRKTLQLCSQVRRVLEYGVDEVLHGEALVAVTDVIPAPDASHLLVLVQPMGDTTVEETEAIQERLVASAWQLRTMVAEGISRRKTPSLSFQVLPPFLLDQQP
ncbi:hypothetical protein SH467x_002829 [Pirellulaceae bacterium SH467]|jgi:ribosome-binding factor A